MKALALLALLPVAAFAQSANELVAVSAESRTGTVISLDFVNSTGTAALEFEVEVGTSDASTVDLSKCLTGAAVQNKMVACKLIGTKVRGVLVSPDLKALPAGQVNLGLITVQGNVKTNVVRWETNDVAGKELTSKVTSAAAATKG
jgi:hypothetical protein